MLKYVEDYILWIAGITGNSGNVVVLPSLAKAMETARISLAHYDISVVYSLAEQIAAGTALTDRQFVLAKQIITKYRRQLSKHGIVVPDTELTSVLGVRAIDRSRSVWFGDNRINAKFPYDEVLIEGFRNANKNNNGSVGWNGLEKVWQLSLTESNINWIVAYAAHNNFAVSDEVLELFKYIAEAENTPYKIELEYNNGYYITNAAESLKEFIEPFITNRDMLVDYSSVLGYTVDSEILNRVVADKGKKFLRLCNTRRNTIPPSQITIAEIIAWAKDVNRLPIIIYSPHAVVDDSMYKLLTTLCDNICLISDDKDLLFPADLYYTSRIIDVPTKLLVSTTSMVFGNKQEWLERSEKVIFYCEKLTDDRSNN